MWRSYNCVVAVVFMSNTLPSSFRTAMSKPNNLFPVSITAVASNLFSFISSAGRFPDRICERNWISSRILWHIGWKLSWFDWSNH